MKIIVIWSDELKNESYKNWEIMKWRVKINRNWNNELKNKSYKNWNNKLKSENYRNWINENEEWKL